MTPAQIDALTRKLAAHAAKCAKACQTLWRAQTQRPAHAQAWGPRPASGRTPMLVPVTDTPRRQRTGHAPQPPRR